MRSNGEGFDLWLRPTDGGSVVPTHRSHFAVMVKSFRYLLGQTSGGRASAPLQVPVDTFALKAVLGKRTN